MFKTILLPIDGSALSLRALPFAQHLARTSQSRLVLVRAYLPSDDNLPLRIEHPDKSQAERAQIELRQAQFEFQAEATRLRETGCLVDAHFVEATAANAICDTARDVQANLVVMSTHGRTGFGRWLYGSVADEVLRRVPIPVLLISAICAPAWRVEKAKRILVPLDGSSLATEVLQPAAALATSLGGAEIMLLTVIEPDVGIYPDAGLQVVSDPVRERAQATAYLQSIASELAGSAQGPVTSRVEYGDPALTIASVAHDANVDAIAIATHGRGGVARLVLGSVATRILQLASVPVLLYKAVILRETVLDRAVEKAFTTSS
jgi:nucleotide-binding universal stress UspA family protein